jgi:hypothetical protein
MILGIRLGTGFCSKDNHVWTDGRGQQRGRRCGARAWRPVSDVREWRVESIFSGIGGCLFFRKGGGGGVGGGFVDKPLSVAVPSGPPCTV